MRKITQLVYCIEIKFKSQIMSYIRIMHSISIVYTIEFKSKNSQYRKGEFILFNIKTKLYSFRL